MVTYVYNCNLYIETAFSKPYTLIRFFCVMIPLRCISKKALNRLEIPFKDYIFINLYQVSRLCHIFPREQAVSHTSAARLRDLLIWHSQSNMAPGINYIIWIIMMCRQRAGPILLPGFVCVPHFVISGIDTHNTIANPSSLPTHLLSERKTGTCI